MSISDITSVIIAIGFLVMTVYLVISVISMVRDDRRRRHSRRTGATVVGVSHDSDGGSLIVIAPDNATPAQVRDRVTLGWRQP